MQLFAFLVGINDYPNVNKLQGSVADVTAMAEFLNQKFTHLNPQIQVLTDAQATRQNVIDAFRTHLSQAQKGDTVYFHFSGHGSREDAPEEFRQFFPEKKNETLVCYDSRLPNGYDLADKELAILIYELAQKNPHIVVCLDCCHSGSGTRTSLKLGAKRQAQKEGNTRSLESYMDGYYTKLKEAGKDFYLPVASHILLSACKANEVAWETTEKRGLFTTTLLETLAQVGTNISYAELFSKVRAKVRIGSQEAQMEVYGNVNAYSVFLNPETIHQKDILSVYFDIVKREWRADKGALQGISTEFTEMIRLQVFPLEVKDLIPENALTEAVVIDLKEKVSVLAIAQADKLDEEKTYQAIITNLPPPSLTIYTEYNETENADLIPQALFELVETKELADYWLLSQADKKLIVHRLSQKMISQNTNNEFIKESLRKIALWENTRTLQNPKTKLNPEEVVIDFFLVENGQDKKVEIINNQLDFDIRQNADGSLEVLECKYQIDNQTPRDLYVAALIISPLYGILQMNHKKIPTGTQAWMNSIDPETQKELSSDWISFYPKTETENNCAVQIKYLISTEDSIDTFPLLQEDFSENILVQSKSANRNLLSSRFLGGRVKGAVLVSDWFTKDLFINLHKADNQAIGKKEVSLLNHQINIKTHSNLTAKIGLGELHTSTRNISGRDVIISNSITENQGIELFNFGLGAKSRNTQSPQFIELSDIQGDVSIANPLEISIDALLNEDELLLPFSFDGEFILPIGTGKRGENGEAMIEIVSIPAEEIKSRSLGRALKFFFYKIIFKYNPEKYFKLRWVEYNQGTASLNEFELKKKVSEANSILLLVHGIIGNTQMMANSVEPVGKSDKNKEGQFDLILTFDYENLNTPIPDIAKELKIKLYELGIKADDGKRVTILAHSMGGLVSRCLIEQQEGNTFIDKLILAGTPNNGSVFGNIASYTNLATLLLSTSLASAILSPVAGLLGGLVLVLSKGQGLMITLEQMHINSSFIRELNTSKDPNIPYYIIAGRVQDYLKENSSETKWLEKLMINASDLMQGDFPHDIAVKVPDILEFDNIDTRNPKGQKYEIACHHLNYFTEPESVALLLKILNENG